MGALEARSRQVPPPTAGQGPDIRVRPLLFGLLAGLGLLGLYLGLISLAQGWSHALAQLAEGRWLVGAIATGFGTQVGLFTYLRELQARAAVGGLAASSGRSTTAMVACCAHHLAEVLPVLGLSGAAILLNAYRSPLLWLGLLMNLAGVAYLIRRITHHRRSTSLRLVIPHKAG